MVYRVIEVIRGLLVKYEGEGEMEDFYGWVDAMIEDYPDVKIRHFYCCSKLNGKFVVIGRVINTINRVEKKCKECDKYSCCDRCIGETVEGFFDVEKILNEATVVPKDDKYIWDDAKIDRDLKVKLGRFCEENEMEPKFETYYMVDDCLSCS